MSNTLEQIAIAAREIIAAMTAGEPITEEMVTAMRELGATLEAAASIPDALTLLRAMADAILAGAGEAEGQP